ncbi:hypothetical protein HCU64_23105 [Methylobacterium sp. C25]|uniref:hypothetical protein n=1 Tax=Methylobacterium sp. C25 TaxID=2721622 RepID=UPI001F43EECA|nr:hypothetical protein [Methylobacterium sp. C25]MCE4226634.1 hypothetical protein [Methylobacterium sp. C25]
MKAGASYEEETLPQSNDEMPRRTEDSDPNDEQQHPGLHTPVGSGAQRIQSDRDVEADENVTVPRRSQETPPETSGPTAPSSVDRERTEKPSDNRKGGYGAG